MSRRCGGIGRHAVLRGQWRQLCASSNLAIGTALVILFFLPFSASALLMGEKARNAPAHALQTALSYYQHGASHEEVWKKTGWHCPFRKRPGCRFEVAECTGKNYLNIVALKHASDKGGSAPLHKVFNALCVYQRYPSMKRGVSVYFGDCAGGALGTASHDGKICISKNLPSRLAAEKQKGGVLNSGRIEEARTILHRVFIHEMQHHIQFAEGWPKFNRGCPYNQRAPEREAFYVDSREALTLRERRATPPIWYKSGLC